MGRITALREHPRRAGRYVLEIEGEQLGPISVEAIAALGLRVGLVLDDASGARAVAATRTVACYDQALDALARRSRSTRDLERWLRDRKHEPGDIAAALEKLTALGLLDDLAFARGFAATRARSRGFGSHRIAAELARRGVARATVDLVLDELRGMAPEAERGALEEAAAKRMRSLRSLEPQVAERRLLGWLVRRGFGMRESAEVARRLARAPLSSQSGA